MGCAALLLTACVPVEAPLLSSVPPFPQPIELQQTVDEGISQEEIDDVIKKRQELLIQGK